MGYKNEDEIKRALAAMIFDMSTEVALKIVEQFPVFKDFAKDVVGAMEKTYESTLSANKQSQEHFHRACQEIRDILKGELNKDDLSWEEKKFIIEQLQETGRMEFQKDSENKQFLSVNLKRVLAGAGAALALGVAFVGGKVMAESKDSPDGSLEA